MDKCDSCNDGYIFLGCCNGDMCGCRGMAVESTNCAKCNPKGDKAPDFIEWPEMEYLEYVGVIPKGVV